ncbi:LOW QUALITY PROTEIN: toxin CrTX-A-like [Argopecten irradians]|uniref:LOW QUALITY PROTEIN: toxin CrTX-A-like n=1 Tax=Argopecten irradians TaxID=31199 RepID=UPI00371DDE31
MTESEVVVAKLQEIGKYLGIENVTDDLVGYLNKASKNGGKIHTILRLIGRIGISLGKVVHGDLMRKFEGVVTLVSTFRELVPIFETPVKEFSNFVSSVLSGNPNSPSCVVVGSGGLRTNDNPIEMLTKVISDLIDANTDSMIKGNAESACRIFTFSHNVIIGAGSVPDKTPTKDDISDIIRLIDINIGIKTLGEIESRIFSMMDNGPQTQSEKDLSAHTERVIKYIDMYCHLAILRDAVMLELYALITTSGYSDCLAEGIKAGLKGEHERDVNMLKPLVLPNQKLVRFASAFDPERWPFTFKFVENCSDMPAGENLDMVPVTMRTLKWMNSFATHDITPSACLLSLGNSLEKPLDKNKHNFLLRRKEGSSCYYILLYNKEDMYVVMKEGDKKWVEVRSGKPGREGEWNIFNVQDNDSVYMLSTRRWPLHFMTMSDSWFGWIQGKVVSLSDPSAHWVIQYNGKHMV